MRSQSPAPQRPMLGDALMYATRASEVEADYSLVGLNDPQARQWIVTLCTWPRSPCITSVSQLPQTRSTV
jgi:hypothetical protein